MSESSQVPVQAALTVLQEGVRTELDAARKSGRASLWVSLLGTVIVAALSAGGTWLTAKAQLEQQAVAAKEALDRQSSEAKRQLDELALQHRQATELTGLQKILDGVLGMGDQAKLRSALAVIVLANLAAEKQHNGLCRFLVTVNRDAEESPDEGPPSPQACRRAAGIVLGARSPETTVGTLAVSNAVATATVGGTPKWDLLVQTIERLGADSATQRVEAARALGQKLNAGLADSVEVFSALVATTRIDVFARLNANARYNTFVVLSEIGPLISARRSDPDFQRAAKELRDNISAIRARVDQGQPDLVGTATARQMTQTMDRLP